MQITSASQQFAGERYTIDTFPEEPNGETHDRTLRQLENDRFQLEGEVYGVNDAPTQGHFSAIDATNDFLSRHNNHDHGNHHSHAPEPIKDIKDMPVDVIVTTTEDRSDIRKVYGMVMNPTHA